MSFHSFFFFFLSFYQLISIQSAELCMPKVEQGITITCSNNCNTCVIDCQTKNICADTTINSGASITTINCFGASSCSNANINIGIYNPDSNLYKPEYNTFTINCPSLESCYNIKLNINGNFINGGILDAQQARGRNQAVSSDIVINLNEGQIFTVYCDDGSRSCNDMNVMCIGGVCKCVGNECNNMIGGGIEINSMYICVFI